MQNYYVTLFFFISAFLSGSTSAENLENNALSIRAECVEPSGCIFRNRMMTIDVIIKNDKKYAIGISIKYLRQVGPYCSLTDNVTKKSIMLDVGLGSHDLMKEFVMLQPGEEVRVGRYISPDEIEYFRKDMVDLNARLTIYAFIKLPQNPEPVEFKGRTSVNIVGLDTLETSK